MCYCIGAYNYRYLHIDITNDINHHYSASSPNKPYMIWDFTSFIMETNVHEKEWAMGFHIGTIVNASHFQRSSQIAFGKSDEH